MDEQIAVRDDRAIGSGQRPQKVGLAPRQSHLQTIDDGPPPRQVDVPTVDAHHGVRRSSGGRPQQDPEPCEQFPDGERLDDVVVRAPIEGIDLLRLGIASREHDDGYVVECADTINDRHAVNIRQAEIEHDGCHRLPLDCGKGLGARLRECDLVPGRAKRGREKPQNLRLVIDD